MSWDYSFNERALKQLRKLGHTASVKIIKYLDEHIKESDNPRAVGKALKGDLGDYWRYRVGDYRILCEIRDHELMVFVVLAGHRRDIYR